MVNNQNKVLSQNMYTLDKSETKTFKTNKNPF